MRASIKRIYEPAEKADGFRVLVDRLWPRGVSKEKAALDLWLKEAAPSGELRAWFGHKPERFARFRKKYLEELKSSPAAQAAVALLKKEAKGKKSVTLLYGAKDPQMNQAAVLSGYLAGKK